MNVIVCHLRNVMYSTTHFNDKNHREKRTEEKHDKKVELEKKNQNKLTSNKN
jgi:hypothetical protein